MSELAQVELERKGSAVVARLSGEIDLSNADQLELELVEAAGTSSSGLLLDLSAVEYLDSAGVRLLFRLQRTLRELGRWLRVVVPAEARIRRVLELADVEQAIPVSDTAEAALAEG